LKYWVFFDFLITSEDVKKGKPHPEIFLLAMERLGTKKEETVIFEDSKNGIKSAIDSGAFVVGVLQKGVNDEFVKDTDFVIEDYKELYDIFKD